MSDKTERMLRLRLAGTSVALMALFTSCGNRESLSANQPNDAGYNSVWLPYAKGIRAVCGQGPNSDRTHKEIFAWDFMLSEGQQVVAVADGRVFWVIDNRAETGFNSFNKSNQIFVDHGGGRFATYLHHKTGTARVQPGQLVAAGDHLADVGKVGTIEPHIHFDLRGPSWRQTHDLRFRTRADVAIEVGQGGRFTSGTPVSQTPPAAFEDSIIQGDEFAENGVRLVGGAKAFRFSTEKPVVLEGWVLRPAKDVGFYLWRSGNPSEYSSRTVPDAGGRFRLTLKAPSSSRGPRWYRVTILDPAGKRPDVATLPAAVE